MMALPKPEAIAPGVVTGLCCPGRAPSARPAPPGRAEGAALFGEARHWRVSDPSSPHRAAGAFAPAWADACRAAHRAFAAPPLACAFASANRTGKRSPGPFPVGPLCALAMQVMP